MANMAQCDHPAIEYLGREEVTVCVLPLFHILAINGTMSNMLWRGGKLVTLPRFDPDLFLSAVATFRPTFLHLAPPLVQFLANHPAVTQHHLASLHTVGFHVYLTVECFNLTVFPRYLLVELQ